MRKKRFEMSGKLIKQALQHQAQHKSVRQSAKELKVNHSTIVRGLQKATGKGISWYQAKNLTDEQISQVLSGRKGPVKSEHLAVDITLYVEKLNEKGHLTAEECWEAYVEQAKKSGKTSYSPSAFYWKLKQELKAKEFTLVMPQQRLPGQYLEIDFAGDVIHSADGKKLREFVASLGWSKLIYAKVVKDITTASRIEGLIGCFEYIGGLPEVILSDNDVAWLQVQKEEVKHL